MVRVLTGQSALTIGKLIELAYDPYLPGFGQLIPGLIQAFDEAAQPNPAIAGPINVLRDRDLRVSEQSVAMTLLAGGQSGDPKLPHFDDQAQRYVNRMTHVVTAGTSTDSQEPAEAHRSLDRFPGIDRVVCKLSTEPSNESSAFTDTLTVCGKTEFLNRLRGSIERNELNGNCRLNKPFH